MRVRERLLRRAVAQVTRSGLLDIKILPRSSSLDPTGPPGPPPEQDIPLQASAAASSSSQRTFRPPHSPLASTVSS